MDDSYEFGVRYGKSIPQKLALDRATLDRMWREIVDLQFNTEGEQKMEKIDWKKPLRVFPAGERNKDQKVYTFKSGKQRVVWIDDHVYPVGDDGRAAATVSYSGTVSVLYGEQIVENVPEEKFFVGMWRGGDGRYYLEDDGVMKTRGEIGLTETSRQWIVDTRKPPKATEYNPKDYTVLYYDATDDSVACGTEYLTTKNRAEDHCAPGEAAMVVRVRTTPPVDTARYIQLWRLSAHGPWMINTAGNGRQEFTWDETKNRGTSSVRCAIKVRD